MPFHPNAIDHIPLHGLSLYRSEKVVFEMPLRPTLRLHLAGTLFDAKRSDHLGRHGHTANLSFTSSHPFVVLKLSATSKRGSDASEAFSDAIYITTQYW